MAGSAPMATLLDVLAPDELWATVELLADCGQLRARTYRQPSAEDAKAHGRSAMDYHHSNCTSGGRLARPAVPSLAAPTSGHRAGESFLWPVPSGRQPQE